MDRANEIDPVADWFAMKFRSAGPSEAAELLAAVETAEACADLLYQLGGRDAATRRREKDAAQGELLPHLDIGRFDVVRLVGRGGMGNVFLAFDPVLQRNVALKIPRLDLRGEPELRRRFLREARTMAGLSHPNLVPILEIGEDGPAVFLVLAWCEGPNLGEWLANQAKPLAPAKIAKFVADLAETLEHCHRQGVIHRDLKPSNVLLDRAEDDDNATDEAFPFVPKITDFGLARVLEESLEQTDSSLLLGTPQYMAPEQAECRHDDVGPHTDVYALGVILYQMLTGATPFSATTAVKLLDQIRHEPPPSLSRSRRDVPKSLRLICETCLQKRTEDRYPSAGALAADLRRFSCGEPIAARPIGTWTRLNRWSQQPARLYNAALVTIVINLIFIGWMIGTAVQDLRGTNGLPLKYSAPVAVARAVTVATILHGVPIVLAVFMLRKRRWALVVTATLAVMLWLWITAVLLGMPAPFPGYDERPVLKVRVFSMLEALSLAQLVALLLALRSAVSRRSSGWRRLQ